MMSWSGASAPVTRRNIDLVAVKHKHGFAHRVHDGLRERPGIFDVLERRQVPRPTLQEASAYRWEQVIDVRQKLSSSRILRYRFRAAQAKLAIDKSSQ
jgi:hypothetical protein